MYALYFTHSHPIHAIQCSSTSVTSVRCAPNVWTRKHTVDTRTRLHNTPKQQKRDNATMFLLRCISCHPRSGTLIRLFKSRQHLVALGRGAQGLACRHLFSTNEPEGGDSLGKVFRDLVIELGRMDRHDAPILAESSADQSQHIAHVAIATSL